MMSDHYYSKQPQVESNQELIEVELRGIFMRFYTDRGVFSKKKIDFGSQLLIEAVEISQDAHVLDIGCGYGPVGLSVAKESPLREITMVDVNERAIQLAKKNAQLNQIENVHITASNLFENLTEMKYDAIISNPPIRAGKDVIYSMFEQSTKYIKQDGCLWIVIQKKQGAPSALKKLSSLYENVSEIEKKKGYYIISASNPK